MTEFLNLFCLERQLRIWRNLELDVIVATKTFVQVVNPSLITWEKLAINSKSLRQLENVDFVMIS